jgi:putative ABC transport system permease protein
VRSGLAQDVRLALRSLARTRLVSSIAILTLALAIGANTAVFSVFNTLLIRPLPVARPDRLVWVSSEYAVANGFTAGAGWNAAMWDELDARSARFGGALAWRADKGMLGRSGEIERIDLLYVSGSFFTTLGVTARYGRVLNTADDRRGGGTGGLVAVSSDHRFDD